MLTRAFAMNSADYNDESGGPGLSAPEEMFRAAVGLPNSMEVGSVQPEETHRGDGKEKDGNRAIRTIEGQRKEVSGLHN